MYVYKIKKGKMDKFMFIFPFYCSPSVINIDVLPSFSRWHSPQEQRESRMDSKDQP